MLATASGLLVHRPVGSVVARHGNRDRIVAIRGAHWPDQQAASLQCPSWAIREPGGAGTAQVPPKAAWHCLCTLSQSRVHAGTLSVFTPRPQAKMGCCAVPALAFSSISRYDVIRYQYERQASLSVVTSPLLSSPLLCIPPPCHHELQSTTRSATNLPSSLLLLSSPLPR
ncbi:hypothetical protein HDV62DRAFT_295455 [Trichoderma sp. SZMC 28011]